MSDDDISAYAAYNKNKKYVKHNSKKAENVKKKQSITGKIRRKTKKTKANKIKLLALKKQKKSVNLKKKR